MTFPPSRRLAKVDSAGNAWAAGYTTGSLDVYTNAGAEDVCLIKADSSGTTQWISQRGGTASDQLHALQARSIRDLLSFGELLYFQGLHAGNLHCSCCGYRATGPIWSAGVQDDGQRGCGYHGKWGDGRGAKPIHVNMERNQITKVGSAGDLAHKGIELAWLGSLGQAGGIGFPAPKEKPHNDSLRLREKRDLCSKNQQNQKKLPRRMDRTLCSQLKLSLVD